jgi:hypothetical protein
MKKIITLFSKFAFFILLIINGEAMAQNSLPIDTIRFLEGFNLTSAQLRYTTGLQTTPQGEIFISFPRIGLAQYTPPTSSSTFGTWNLHNQINTNNLLASDTIHCIYYDSTSSELWIAQNKGITRKNSNSFVSFPFITPYDYTTNKINDIAKIGQYVYLATNSGLLVYNTASNNWYTVLTSNSFLPNDTINSFFVSDQQSLWICTNDGAIKLNTQGIFSNLLQIPNGIVKYIATTQNDTLIAGISGIYQKNNTSLVNLDSNIAVSNSILYSSNNISGTYGCNSTDFGVTPNTIPPFTQINIFSPFICDKNGDIYFLSRYSTGNAVVFSIKSGLKKEGLIAPTVSSLPTFNNFLCRIAFHNDSLLILQSLANYPSNIGRLKVIEKKSNNYTTLQQKWFYNIFNNSYFAIPNSSSIIGNNGGPTLNIFNNQSVPSAQADINFNGVRFRVLNGGDLHWDPVGQTPYYEVPQGSGKNSVYASSIWLGGIDQQGSLYSAAQTYRQGGSCDFWPGWIGSNGQTWAYDKILVVSRSEIDRFKLQFLQGNLNNGTYQIPDIILNWPAKHPSVNTELAPFIDYNNDGNYNPYDGDYPDIKGDIMAWWTFNDVANTKTESNSAAMGVEIHGSAYVYFCNDPATTIGRFLNFTTFYHYDIFNKSQNNYDSCYFGMWSDFDLGNAADDLVGCDLNTNSFYVYNGDPNDDGGAGYGLCAPVQNVQFLKTPNAPLNDGIDNNHNGIIDENNEQLGLSKFVYYVNTNNVPNGNPNTADDYYEYLSGKWLDGLPITYGGDGRLGGSGATSIPCSYMFPNNTDPNFSTPWTMVTANIQPDDMRGMGSTGPFTLPIGSKKSVDIAYLTGPSLYGNTGTISNHDILMQLDSLFRSGNLDNNRSFVPIGGQSVISNYSSTYIYTAPNYGSSSVCFWSVNNGTIISGQGTNQVVVKWDTLSVCDIQIQIINPLDPCAKFGALSITPSFNNSTSINQIDFSNPIDQFSIVPNPATENTTIRINLSNSSITTISVYDITGRLVQTLNNSSLPAGNHTFTWDLNENNAKAKAGVYLIKVTANGFSQTKRVVVL